MSFKENLSLFLDDVFGFAVQASLDGQTVIGIFERPGSTADASGFGVSASVPTFMLKEQDAGQSFGKTLIVDGISWVVSDIKPDGTGIVTLFLEKP